MSRDDVVVQRPEDIRVVLPVFHTWSACAGSATSYVLRRICYRAGTLAPGIQEFTFHELTTQMDGATLERVHGWFQGRVSLLHEMGYRLQCRRVCTPTPAILDWVREGRGHRGAMLPTAFKKMHPKAGQVRKDVPHETEGHAVGITVDRLDDKGDEQLVMIDPWPGDEPSAADRGPVSRALEPAHRDRGFHALVFYWVGWS
ncbi:MAG: hypothetical protein KF773_20930 [Deltaproteobacteria bacterium]|nr:hypothetical protein [Deltaproteobacteria bacterium]MCW5805781.1 hypothetical protein [Deltaproteobacteria bacterium]